MQLLFSHFFRSYDAKLYFFRGYDAINVYPL
jgi:hypothetical protein